MWVKVSSDSNMLKSVLGYRHVQDNFLGIHKLLTGEALFNRIRIVIGCEEELKSLLAITRLVYFLHYHVYNDDPR